VTHLRRPYLNQNSILDSSIEYLMSNPKFADSSATGLIEGLMLGSTRLTARAVGFDRAASNKKIVYSEDSIDVHVVKLSGVRISAPIRRLRTGAEMPLKAMGMDEQQNAFAFGSALPNLKLEWSISDSVSHFTMNSAYFSSFRAQANY